MSEFQVRSQLLRLNGPAVVLIDWANVYGWQKKLNQKIIPHQFFAYFRTHPLIREQYFYFGTDRHPKSKKFLQEIVSVGFRLRTKPVKYIKTSTGLIRKCDFDLEITIDTLELIDEIQTYIFITGDGDFAALYEKLLRHYKQVIVVYHLDFLGREIWDMKKDLYLLDIKILMKKLTPRQARGKHLE